MALTGRFPNLPPNSEVTRAGGMLDWLDADGNPRSPASNPSVSSQTSPHGAMINATSIESSSNSLRSAEEANSSSSSSESPTPLYRSPSPPSTQPTTLLQQSVGRSLLAYIRADTTTPRTALDDAVLRGSPSSELDFIRQGTKSLLRYFQTKGESHLSCYVRPAEV